MKSIFTLKLSESHIIHEAEEECGCCVLQLEEHGPFSDLNNLKHRPGHLAVFLYYLMSNSDPSPLVSRKPSCAV